MGSRLRREYQGRGIFYEGFQQLGWRGADTFETQEAQEVGQRVRKELSLYQATLGAQR